MDDTVQDQPTFFFFKISSLYDEISFGSMLLLRMQKVDLDVNKFIRGGV
jgi:hypothetical protein